jgi:hypothetical protein
MSMIRRPVRPGQPVNTTIAGHVHMVVPVQTVRMPVSQGRRFGNQGAPRAFVRVAVLRDPCQVVDIDGDGTRCRFS